jgi:hypothetical protein
MVRRFNKLKKDAEEAVVTCFEVLSFHLPEGTGKTTKSVGRISGVPGVIRTNHLTDTK